MVFKLAFIANTFHFRYLFGKLEIVYQLKVDQLVKIWHDTRLKNTSKKILLQDNIQTDRK